MYDNAHIKTAHCVAALIGDIAMRTHSINNNVFVSLCVEVYISVRMNIYTYNNKLGEVGKTYFSHVHISLKKSLLKNASFTQSMATLNLVLAESSMDKYVALQM